MNAKRTGEANGARIGILGLSERNFDLLPALWRDPAAFVLWVRSEDSDAPLSRLAELLEFPVIADPENAAEVDLLIVRGADVPHAAGKERPAGRTRPGARGSARVVPESDLRRILRAGRFDWERLQGERRPGERRWS